MDPARHDQVRRWLIAARRHFETAHQIASCDGHLDMAVFHCHEAAKTALTGFLAFHNDAHNHSDDLVQLVAAAVRHEPGFAHWTDAARTLNSCAAVSGSPPKKSPSRSDFHEALAAARQFVTFVPLLLPHELHSH